MCSGENLNVQLTAEGNTLAVATHDDDGKPLTAPEAAVLYVILRFGEDGALLSVRQAIRPGVRWTTYRILNQSTIKSVQKDDPI